METTGLDTIIQQIDAARPQHEGKRAVILGHLRTGCHRSLACQLTRIDRSTFYRWLAADDEFRMDCEQAEALAECEVVAVLMQAVRSPKTWQAAAWWLERRGGPEWRRPEVHGLSRTLQRVEAALLQMSPEARAEFARHYGENELLATSDQPIF